MRYAIIAFVLAIAGCSDEGNPMGPLPISTSSDIKNGILYTFAVANNSLGIFDTLSMTLTAFNQTTSPETLLVSGGSQSYTWSLTNAQGATIISGPWLEDNLVARVVLNPQETRVLYSLSYSMADLFNAPIRPGMYGLHWNLTNGPSFQLNLACGKSRYEISDPAGVSSPIFPLKVGNSWTYKLQRILADGSHIDDGTVVHTIVGEEMLDGEKWFLLRAPLFGDQILSARSDGIYLYYPHSKTAVLRYQYPAKGGEQYESYYEEWLDNSFALVAFPMAADSGNVEITVPGGRYTCRRYSAPQVLATSANVTNIIDPMDYYLSTIGPVRIDFYAGNGIVDDIDDLVSTNVQ